jgi:hypothetical protein
VTGQSRPGEMRSLFWKERRDPTAIRCVDRLISHSWAPASDVSMDNLVAGHNTAEGCGGSVASRGLMWSNAHPAPKRWLPLKGPLWFTVARAVQANMSQLQEASAVNAAPWYVSFRFGALLDRCEPKSKNFALLVFKPVANLISDWLACSFLRFLIHFTPSTLATSSMPLTMGFQGQVHRHTCVEPGFQSLVLSKFLDMSTKLCQEGSLMCHGGS